MRIRKRILQKIADIIIKILEKEENPDIFNFYMNIGLQIDAHAISHKIYLD